jgi:hypothetical protein
VADEFSIIFAERYRKSLRIVGRNTIFNYLQVEFGQIFGTGRLDRAVSVAVSLELGLIGLYIILLSGSGQTAK